MAVSLSRGRRHSRTELVPLMKEAEGVIWKGFDSEDFEDGK